MPDHRSLRRSHAAIFAVAGMLASGCHIAKSIKDKSYETFRAQLTSSYHDPDPDAKMAKAEALFAEQKYAEAQAIFGDVADNTYNPVLMMEKARYQEAECLRLRGRVYDAAAHFNRMLNDFPAGAYRERGCTQLYEIAYGWLKDGLLADIERETVANNPKKWYEKGPSLPNFTDKSKPILDQEGEALKYLEVCHTHDITGPTADKALFWCGYVHFYRNRFEEADHFFSQIVELHKDSPLWKESLKLAVIAKNNSTGGAVYDSTKASEALQLVHHAEAAVPEFAQDKEKSAWLMRQKMAVRMQLAEKDFRTAQYYERTKHPASAYFYYELVTRRYPGTKFAAESTERLRALEHVKEQMAADRAAGKSRTPFEAIKKEWAKLTGDEPKAAEAVPTEPAAVEKGPAGPTDAPVRTPQVDISNPR